MLKKTIVMISFILISLYGTAQKDINNYKYVLIPKKFDFSKSEDQYQLNSLTKFLFNKYGYEAYFLDEDLPEDLKKDRCLALTTEVSNEKSGLFKTKLEIMLKDCSGTIIITSKTGESRLKDYKKAYNEAIRATFKTFQNLDYHYVSNQEETIETPTNKTVSVKNESVTVTEEPKKKIDKEIKGEVTNSAEVITKIEKTTESISEIYYAQAIKNGFQLVNSEPKIVMILLNTAAKDVFIVKDKNAIVFKKDKQWMYSKNDGISISEKELNIKF